MPRGKKRTKKRRMGAIRRKPKTGDKIQRALGVVGGLLLTAVANDKIASSTTTPINPYLLSGVEAVVGFFGPDFVGGGPLVEGLGLGIMGAAGVSIMKEAGVIAGIDNVVNGWGNSLGAYDNRKVINGISNVPEIIAEAAKGNGGNNNGQPKYSGSYAGYMNGVPRQRYDESQYGVQ